MPVNTDTSHPHWPSQQAQNITLTLWLPPKMFSIFIYEELHQIQIFKHLTWTISG